MCARQRLTRTARQAGDAATRTRSFSPERKRAIARPSSATAADTAEAEYAPGDGHPVRIVLDWEENAVDDEARYTISAYAPADGRRAGDPAEPRPAS
ncbi:DUF6174 domain-containing protein [Streptomyces sp. NPDC003007]